jgi:hypothetical protein
MDVHTYRKLEEKEGERKLGIGFCLFSFELRTSVYRYIFYVGPFSGSN